MLRILAGAGKCKFVRYRFPLLGSRLCWQEVTTHVEGERYPNSS
ncbi:hypothetical protein [Paenibacillus sp. J2TS4]|nr:hypothetical protein [Paenibacillus sp. J2TS4]